MRQFSVFIPDGDNHRALKVVRSLAYGGCRNIYILADKNRNVHFSRHCKSFLLHGEYGRDEERLRQVVDISKAFPIDILLPISENGIRFVNSQKKILQKYFRTALIPDDRTFEIARDKGLFHDFAVRHRLSVPKSIPLADYFTDSSVLNSFSFPVLLKPFIGEGGNGIKLIPSAKQFHRFFADKENPNLYKHFLIQEYIKGWDTDLSVLCKNGKIRACTVQVPLVKHGGDFSFGKIIRFIRHDEILDTGKKLLSLLGWNGIVHIDFLIEEKSGDVKILEMNPRFWGSLYGSVSAGVNFPYLACLAALGESFPCPRYEKTVYAELSNMEKLFLLLGKKQSENISLKDTDFRYMIRDISLFQKLKSVMRAYIR
ncbi:MAG: ATP-grasp domain-containing protein [Desulfococcaceae bacterium]|jgi:predicted ATP-grasp superfamily ATP-dependent carboligase|nr:ATP-grasp domain-containing protein [Desulfococcaceae bacterium]